jgi:hypothetical protein
MCLISKWKFPRKASGNIECYKVLYKKGSEYITPFMDIEVDINKPLKARGWGITFSNPYEKTAGYIHTYTSLASAKILFGPDPTTVIFKCIIPTGTKYHISNVGSEYCSKQIKFISQVPSYEVHNIY